MAKDITKLVQESLKKRHRQEKTFKMLGRLSIAFALVFLVAIFTMIFSKGYGAFLRTEIALNINLSEDAIIKNSDGLSDPHNLDQINYRRLIKQALRDKFPEAQDVNAINNLYQLTSKIASLELKEQVKKHPELIGKESKFWLSASSKVDIYFKHQQLSNLKEDQLILVQKLIEEKNIRKNFNWKFFSFADSREPEIAGIGASIIGSFFAMTIFLVLAFPIGIMCAFYLEEFAPKNRLTDIIEVSINNLAAIPSIIYGLLGLTIYLQYFYLPRSSALVGGMTLFMLVLPVIIIATRNTIRSIPNTIRDAAMGLGASKMQLTLHHLLPLSVPGIMTGTILAVSRALGETAPLLMIGMVAFIADIPKKFTDPTTVLPVQIYLWSDSPESGFAEKTAAAIIILLALLVIFNLAAIILRKKFERKW